MPRIITPCINTIRTALTVALDELEAVADAIREVQTSGHMDGTVTLFADLRDRQEQVKRLSAKLAKISDEMSFEILPDLFARTNTVSPYNHIRGKFVLATRTNASVKDGMKDPAYAWLEDNELGSIIIRTIPWQTLGATASDLIKSGRDLPSEYFEVNNRVYTRFTPAGKKDE